MWLRMVGAVCLGVVLGSVTCWIVVKDGGPPEDEYLQYRPIREELETLQTYGPHFGRLIEISWDLIEQWPESQGFVESLIESRILSLQWVCLHTCLANPEEVSPKTLERARALAGSRDAQVRYFAISFLPEEDREEQWLKLAGELTESFEDGALVAGGVLSPLTDTLGQNCKSPAAEEALCRILLLRDKGLRHKAAKYLIERRSRKALARVVNLIQGADHQYERSRSFALAVFLGVSGKGLAIQALGVDNEPWMTATLREVLAWVSRVPNIEDKSEPLPPFEMPANPMLSPPPPAGARPD